MMIFGRSVFLGIGENMNKEFLYFLLYLILYGLILLCSVFLNIKWILQHRVSKKTLFLAIFLLTIHTGMYFFHGLYTKFWIFIE